MSNSESKLKLLMANFEAEDAAISYLAGLPEKIAVIKAVKAATALDLSWESELERMLERGDDSEVYLSTKMERYRLAEMVASCSQDARWQACSCSDLQQLFTHLSSDAAAFVAYKVAQYVYYYGRRKWRT
jgi:hypothetical protein